MSVWKRITLATLTVAALGWTISASAGRSVRANTSPALPMSFSLAVVQVPGEAHMSELERLKVRTRRLEALVSVLKSRPESGQ